MAAAYRTLDLTLLSAKDLKDVNVFSKMDVYAVVCIAGEPRSVQRTPIEKNAGKKPSWNATLRFFVPDDPATAAGLVVHVALRSKRILGDRDIGDVHIPVHELLDEGGDKHSESPQIVSYQVHKPKSRKPKGALSTSPTSFMIRLPQLTIRPLLPRP